MLDPRVLRLIAITPELTGEREGFVDRLTAAVRGGATCVQVRQKKASPRECVEIARLIIAAVTVPVIVNDRADIALAAGAAGVHVGAADLPVVAVRRFAPPGFIIGASLGSDDELANARDADYVGIGPVRTTQTKDDAGSAIGVDGFTRLASLVSLPAVGVGGVDALAAARLVAAGAAGVAVSSGIFSSLDPESATRQFASATGT
ncbi:MAG TPA: thiamine phosphate synthase [Gemmatimonadaceae bacterium]|nr:thiamine phosphate synthase [Gemmatimonadaceae bacterium]